MKITKSQLKNLVYHVNGAAIEVHKALGAGLLESVYHKCLKHELELRKINFVSEKDVFVDYKGLKLTTDYRCDFLVENILPVEIKSVMQVHHLHEAQLMSYMKLLKLPMGLMINFNVTHIYDFGQKTYVNELYRDIEP